MLDEEMDHIIRDAVEKHHPAYNDKAWEKMEKKLDKHLPQKEGRRRYLFFLLLFLMLGGAAYFGINYFNAGKPSAGKEIADNKRTEQLPGGNKKDQQLNDQPGTQNKVTAAESLPDKTTEPAGENNKDVPAGNIVSAVNTNTNNTGNLTPGNSADQTKNNTNPVKEIAGIKPPVNRNSGTGTKNLPAGRPADDVVNTSLKNKRSTVIKKGKSNMRITAPGTDNGLVNNDQEETKTSERMKGKKTDKLQGKTADKMNITVTAAEPENKETENKETALAEIQKAKEAVTEQKKDSVKKEAENKEKETAKTENKTSSSPDKKKQKKNIAGNFGITLSAGPDLSFIKLNKLGQATLAYGAGLSYTFKKRVTVRAGFYASKKIYTAAPDQYYIPPGSYYPGLYQVDAVCKVYEIPVSFSYNFWQRKNHNWFGNAGLSSFLMKSEKYDYIYKYYGQTYNYKTEIKNQNKHYFAVLTLSAGYQYNFNKWLSVQAEPYVKIPLGGVGQGKIKLNSSGVLFTATIRPFAKKK